MASQLPSVSVVIPTLNAERHLASCLGSLRMQRYGGEVEVVLVDAGSSDQTLAIARRFDVDRILPNPLSSGEAGKAIGVNAATGDLVLLLDSDNSLVGSDWMIKMVQPFLENARVIGCEPARFAYRKSDHPINRWHALLGAADPLTIYTGNYARNSVLTGTWTGCPYTAIAHEGWDQVELDRRSVPVFGANGFLIRRDAYALRPVDDYLFDLDHIHELVATGRTTFARVDCAVSHAFCDGISKFRSKTRRRVDDFFFFSSRDQRSYPWTSNRRRGIADFALSTVLVIPVVKDALRGHRLAPDAVAWAWHPVACWITLLTYCAGVIRGRIRPRMLSRENWQQ